MKTLVSWAQSAHYLWRRPRRGCLLLLHYDSADTRRTKVTRKYEFGTRLLNLYTMWTKCDVDEVQALVNFNTILTSAGNRAVSL